MRTRTALAAGIAVLVLATAASLSVYRGTRFDTTRLRARDAIRAVVDTSRLEGWIDTFEAQRPVPLRQLDPRWQPLFGEILVDPRRGVIGDPRGGWQQDGGDDYSFRVVDVPLGDVAIIADGWWDGVGSFAVQGVVQAEPPHRLYEAAIWRGRLAIVYFIGPGPEQYEILSESPPLGLKSGDYRLAFCMWRQGAGWVLRAAIRDPRNAYRVLGVATASDSRLSRGGQGIGMLGGGGGNASFIRGIAVRALESADNVKAGPECDK